MVLVLLGVVIAMAVLMLSIVQEWRYRTREKMHFQVEWTTLYSHLKWDLYQSNTLQTGRNELTLSQYPDDRPIRYEMERDRCLRISADDTTTYEVACSMREINGLLHFSSRSMEKKDFYLQPGPLVSKNQ